MINIHFLEVDGTLLEKPAFCPTEAELVKMYRDMWTARLVDERMITLQRQGVITFAMSSLGEEACAVASAAALNMSDWLYPQYREVGCLFYRGFSIQDYVHHMFCNGKDIIKGRQMPNHFGSRKLNIVTVSSPIGTKIPHAAGCAYAMKVKKEKNIALVYFGEGAASEGDFHAGVNFAAVYKAPTIFFCRNNKYAISTKACSQYGGEGVVQKAEGYGIRGLWVDGNDVFAVYHATKIAKELCLNNEGPVIIEAETYRMGPHSTSDDPTRYRPDAEVEAWKEKDPIKRLRAYLEKNGLWNDTKENELQESLTKEIVDAINVAKREGPPPLESLIEDVYEKVPRKLQVELDEVRRVL